MKAARLHTLAHTIEPSLVREIDYVTPQLLLRPLGAREIENVVAVDVFLIETAVAGRAVGADVAERIDRAVLVAADRRLAHGARTRRFAGYGIGDDRDGIDEVSGNAGVVRVRVEGSREGITLGVEPVVARELLTEHERVARRRRIGRDA